MDLPIFDGFDVSDLYFTNAVPALDDVGALAAATAATAGAATVVTSAVDDDTLVGPFKDVDVQPQQQQQQQQQPGDSAASLKLKASAQARAKRNARRRRVEMPEVVTEETKASMSKRQLNKLAADKYRKKKREQFELLTKENEKLRESHSQMAVKCEQLEQEVSYLKQLLEKAMSDKEDKMDEQEETNSRQPQVASKLLKQPHSGRPSPASSCCTTDAEATQAQGCSHTQDRLARIEAQLELLISKTVRH